MKLILSLLLLIPFLAAAQQATDPVLDTYLSSHSYTVSLSDSGSITDKAITDLLSRKMEGKRLLIYGEGFSHNLPLNTELRRLLIRSMPAFRYYFKEEARSWVVEDLLRMDSDLQVDSRFIQYSHFSPAYYKAEKELYAKGKYEYIAIDFERKESFHRSLSMLLSTVPVIQWQQLCRIAPYFSDTAYLRLSRKKFVVFYRQQQAAFYADSNSFKPLLGKAYTLFRYLMSDPHPSSFNDNRNSNMAGHLLQQINTPEPQDVYLLSIGLSHVQKKDGIRKTTTNLLSESAALRGKILIASLYCDGCKKINGGGSNGWYKHLKGDALASFQKATGTGITLFDLTGLPDEYKGICNNVDLLLFARNY